MTLLVKPVPVNQKYSIICGKNYLSKKYRTAKEDLAYEIRSAWKHEIRKGSVCMNILLYFGDNRRRDIDAYLKILLDAMTGIVYEDDSQIDEMHVFKQVDIKSPRTVIQIL